jgi:hypothetical protein
MPNRSLRLFPSPPVQNNTNQAPRRQREIDRICGINEPKSVTIPLATLVPLMIEASENNRAWLNDFSDETVRVDQDLYEVLMAYQTMQTNKVA